MALRGQSIPRLRGFRCLVLHDDLANVRYSFRQKTLICYEYDLAGFTA